MSTNELRIFNAEKADGSRVKMSIRNPTKREIEGSDMEFSRMYNVAVFAGLPTHNSMIRELRKNGLWGDLQSQQLEAARDRVTVVEERIEKIDGEIKALKPEEKDALKALTDRREPLQKEREEQFARFNELRIDFEDLTAHTADSKASNSQREYMIACTIEFADGPNKGKRVWPSKDALADEIDVKVKQRVAYEYLMFVNGIPSTWVDTAEPVVKNDVELAPKVELPPPPAAPATDAPPAPTA